MTDLTGILADEITVPYPALLDALHERCGPGRLTASPARYVLASSARLPGADDSPLRRFGLAFATAAEPAAVPGAADRFAAGLLALHRDLLRRALRHAMGHLDGRTCDGTSLLSRQLIQGQLADIAMTLSAEEAMPPARREDGPQARWRSHQRMVATGRELVRLLGASGFLTDSPAADLYLAEVAGNVYLHPGGPDD
jgi:hypothetical protein